MEDSPKDPRIVAMLSALFGREWEKLEGDLSFEKTPIETWVFAIETMLKAADGVDPIRVAIRGITQESEASDEDAPAMPSRSES